MTPEERNEINEAMARLDGWVTTNWLGRPDRWHHETQCSKGQWEPPNYLDDPRLWVPWLEKALNNGWKLTRCGLRHEDGAYWSGNVAETVCRLAIATGGEM